jgi:hypothetical protein
VGWVGVGTVRGGWVGAGLWTRSGTQSGGGLRSPSGGPGLGAGGWRPPGCGTSRRGVEATGGGRRRWRLLGVPQGVGVAWHRIGVRLRSCTATSFALASVTPRERAPGCRGRGRRRRRTSGGARPPGWWRSGRWRAHDRGARAPSLPGWARGRGARWRRPGRRADEAPDGDDLAVDQEGRLDHGADADAFAVVVGHDAVRSAWASRMLSK